MEQKENKQIETPMKKPKLPKTDSVQKLAEFRDIHDLTEFEDELCEVAEPVFMRGSAIKVQLASGEVKAVKQMASAKGISREELIHAGVIQRLADTKERASKRYT